MKKKKEKRKEKERRKKQREKEIESGERKGIWKILPFKLPHKDDKEKD